MKASAPKSKEVRRARGLAQAYRSIDVDTLLRGSFTSKIGSGSQIMKQSVRLQKLSSRARNESTLKDAKAA